MINLDAVFLNWLLAFPFFAALLAAVFPRFALQPHSEAEAESLPRAPFALGALACLMGVSISVFLLTGALQDAGAAADYWWTSDLYQLRYRADSLSAAMTLTLYLIGFLVNLHLYGLPTPSYPHRRAAALLVGLGCAAAAMLSADLIAMVFFTELALLSLWLLASLDAPRMSDRMLVIGHAGVALVLGGALVMWQQAGGTGTEGLSLVLLTVPVAALHTAALLVLLGVVPLLAAIPATPWLSSLVRISPRTALLVALVLVPLGMSVALRLLPGSLLLPQVPGFAGLSLLLGLLSLWWGAASLGMARGLGQAAAALLVAQSGQFLLALAAAANPATHDTSLGAARQALAIHALAAPLALLALWSAVGSVIGRVGTDALAGVSGLWRKLPLAGVAFLLGGLSLAGLPPLPGFWSQWLLLRALFGSGRWLLGTTVLLADLLLLIGAVNVFRKAFLRQEAAPTLLPAQRWLNPQVGLAVIALLILAALAGPLQGWSSGVAAHLLSVSP